MHHKNAIAKEKRTFPVDYLPACRLLGEINRFAIQSTDFAESVEDKLKNKYVLFTSGVLALIFVFTSTSYSWDGRAHMMVAAVAYNKLTQQTKDRVDTLLLLNPDRDHWLELIPEGTSPAKTKMMIFMVAATWADRIKKDPDYHTDGTHNGNRPPNDPSASQNIGYDDLARHKYWHFEDLPFTQDNSVLPAVPAPNARTQINTFRAVLASNEPDPLKSYDLSWFLHLIGDLHQPLHCTTRIGATQPEGDDGGNGVKLTSPGPANLHTFFGMTCSAMAMPLRLH